MTLIDEFHRDMVDTYVRARRECNYNATLFMKMVSEMGGVQTARTLLAKPGVSDGFAVLWEKGRLDLAMESRVLDAKYRSLFTLNERRIAWSRLKEHGLNLPEPVDLDENEEGSPHAGRAENGSRCHLQDLVNRQPEYLNCLLLSSSASLRAQSEGHPAWLSPLENDAYREYQDDRFLEQLGLREHAHRLAEFWPRGGPVWDGLAVVPLRTGRQGVILVEAKAHLSELKGPGCRASAASREQIARSLSTVRQMLGADPTTDWMGTYYQYANRLAFLWFLNTIAHVPTWLVSLYSVGDTAMNGPRTVSEWLPAWAEQRAGLGLPDHHLLEQQVITVCAPTA